jgi:dienelactone hydrolase
MPSSWRGFAPVRYRCGHDATSAREESEVTVSRRRRSLCAGLVLAAAAPVRALETPAGIEVRDLDWFDVARRRPVPVRLYAPRQSMARALPLVVFSHGIGGSRTGYGYLGRHWASHGVASLHLQHVGSDRQVWFGNPLALLERLQDAARDREAIDRTRDFRFALDGALAGAAGIEVDARRIVAAGHSYGANTALLVSGARVRREGVVMDLRDERVRAAVVISTPPFYGEPDLSRILAPVTIPSLHITTTEDVIRIPGYYSDVTDRLEVFEAIGGREKWLAVFEGGSHSLFTGRFGEGSAVLRATRELAQAFTHRVFEHDDRNLAAWPRQHAALIERFVGPELKRPQRFLTTE